MPHEGMTPHISGTSLSAQARYSAGTREILECYFEGRPIRDEYLIVDGGKLPGPVARRSSSGNATGGHEEVARYSATAREDTTCPHYFSPVTLLRWTWPITRDAHPQQIIYINT